MEVLTICPECGIEEVTTGKIIIRGGTERFHWECTSCGAECSDDGGNLT